MDLVANQQENFEQMVTKWRCERPLKKSVLIVILIMDLTLICQRARKMANVRLHCRGYLLSFFEVSFDSIQPIYVFQSMFREAKH